MAKRKIPRSLKTPLNPKIHYVLFLILALILIVVVGVVMQQTAADTRARLVCPNQPEDPVNLVENLSHQCPNGIQYTKDANGCGVWVCRNTN